MARILIIDDYLGTRETVARLLALEGYWSVTAALGREGIDRALCEPFDVILCDLRLPDLSGIEVVRELQAHGVAAPVVVMTRFPELETSFEAGASGAAGYVYGVLSAEELLSLVASTLQRSTSTAEHRRFGGKRGLEADSSPSRNTPANLRAHADPRLRHAIECVETNPSLVTKQVAHAVGMSESRLRCSFKAFCGVTIGQYIASTRLQAAARSLLTTREPIRNIAARVGISNARYFSKLFRRHFHMAPKQYRAQFRTLGSRFVPPSD